MGFFSDVQIVMHELQQYTADVLTRMLEAAIREGDVITQYAIEQLNII